MDFIFDEIPNQLVPFDMDTFRKNSEELVIVTTDCETGQPVYFDKTNQGEDLVLLLRASSSLPFVASSVEYRGRHLLDGGIVDPIPIKKAQQDGFEKNVIILTKPEGYYKRPSKMTSLLKYKKHTKINDLLGVRNQHYNETIKYIDEQEKLGKALVKRPRLSLLVM